MRNRSLLVGLSLGVLIGALGVGGALFAQDPTPEMPSDPESAPGTYDIVDTSAATYLLDKEKGHVWRLGWTEVRGDRYWFGTFVPLQEPESFRDFQSRLQKLANQPRR